MTVRAHTLVSRIETAPVGDAVRVARSIAPPVAPPGRSAGAPPPPAALPGSH